MEFLLPLYDDGHGPEGWAVREVEKHLLAPDKMRMMALGSALRSFPMLGSL
jgi:hypothetical protein